MEAAKSQSLWLCVRFIFGILPLKSNFVYFSYGLRFLFLISHLLFLIYLPLHIAIHSFSYAASLYSDTQIIVYLVSGSVCVALTAISVSASGSSSFITKSYMPLGFSIKAISFLVSFIISLQ